MVYIVLDVQVVSQGCTATKGDATGTEWGGDLSAKVGGLVMAPAIQLARNQLLAGAMPTHPPHAVLGPSAQWIPLWHKDTLWGSPFPLPSEEAVGFPKLCLGGVPRHIRLLPKLPPGSPCSQRHLRGASAGARGAQWQLGPHLFLQQPGELAGPALLGLGPGTREFGRGQAWSGRGSGMKAPPYPSPSHKLLHWPSSLPESRPQMGLDPGGRRLPGEVDLKGQGWGQLWWFWRGGPYPGKPEQHT